MLQIKISGTVRAKDIKAGFQGGDRKLNVVVSYDGGMAKAKLDPASYDSFPAIGQPVVLFMTGDMVQGEYGARIEKLTCLKFEAVSSADAPPLRRAA